MQPPCGCYRRREKQERTEAEYLVRRDEYLADDRVSGFTRWASQWVTGEVPLEHRWQSRNRSLCCTSLYDALVNYRWPENRHVLDHRATAQKLQKFRDDFRDIGAIDSCTKQTQFIDNAEVVIKWGGIPVPRKLREWRRMQPSKLHALIERTKKDAGPTDLGNAPPQGVSLHGVRFQQDLFFAHRRFPDLRQQSGVRSRLPGSDLHRRPKG